MHTLLSSSFAVFLAVSPAAQNPDMAALMQPAPELKKLEVMVGSFAGSGTVIPAPSVPAVHWTARTTTRWALANHALEETAVIEFAEGAMPPLRFVTYIGFDREAKHYVVVSASQMGVVSKPAWFLSDTEFVSTHAHVAEGLPYVDHDIARFGKDGYEFVLTRIAGKGGPFEHVKGKFQRAPEAKAIAAEASAGKPSPEMAKLARLAGTWKVTGTMVMGPGQAPMPISGTETNAFAFGGSVLQSRVAGDPAPGDSAPSYESVAFVGWDAVAGCYAQVVVDTMGMIGRTDGRFVGADQFAFTSAAPQMGAPTAGRALIEFAKDGTLKVTSDRLVGASPALRDFEAVYRPAK